jgi:hypothetical protein
VADGGWAPTGPQTFVFNSVSINGVTDSFGPAGLTKDGCKNSGWQALGFKNQGQCVSSAVK